MKEWGDVRHDAGEPLNLLTDCDELCHVIHIIYLDRAKMERCAVPPYFLHHVEDSACDFGDVAQLHCDVTGQPAPTIAWFKEGRDEPLCEFSGKYSVIQNCGHVILMIDDVTHEDIGRYTCKIHNDVGVTSSTGRLFFSPQYREQLTTKEKDLKKLIVEETLKIVERRDFPDMSSILPNLSSHSNDTVAIAFAMPEHCHTNVITVSTTRNGVDSETELSLMPFVSMGEQFPHSSRRATSRTESSSTKSPIDDDIETESLTDDDVISRLDWIEEGRKSESDFRKQSIPYPLSLDPEAPVYPGKTPLHSFEGGVISQRSVDSDSSHSESLMTWGDFPEKRTRTSRRRAALTRSYSSGSGSSGVAVGGGRIGRAVRAMSQNEYFDTFFDKRSDENDGDVMRDPLFMQPTLKEVAAENDVINPSEDSYLNLNQSQGPDTSRDHGPHEYLNGLSHGNHEQVTSRTVDEAEADDVFETKCEVVNEKEVTSQLRDMRASTEPEAGNGNKDLETKISEDLSASVVYQPIVSENTSSLSDVNSLISTLLKLNERPQVLISCLKICKNTLDDVTQSCGIKTFNVSVSQRHLAEAGESTIDVCDGGREQTPKFLIPLQDTTALESGITLNVAVTARPSPSVTWYHDGRRLDDGLLETTNHIAASGNYSCVATNQNGEASTSCYVTIADPNTSSSPTPWCVYRLADVSLRTAFVERADASFSNGSESRRHDGWEPRLRITALQPVSRQSDRQEMVPVCHRYRTRKMRSYADSWV